MLDCKDDQSELVVKMLNQKADKAGAQLTITVPKTSANLLSCISKGLNKLWLWQSIARAGDSRYDSCARIIPCRIIPTKDFCPQHQRYHAHNY
jgi:hypothetical protein